jgi:predicted PurR-regulated permease PerM
MRRGNPRRRRGRRLPGEWPYFFLAPFFAGFFAAFFVAIGTPPPFSLEISFIVLFHIAEIASLVKFFFSFFVFTVLALSLLYPHLVPSIARRDQNFSDFQKALRDFSEFHHNENLHSDPSMDCP